MADFEISQLTVGTPVSADIFPFVKVADHSTPPAGAGGSDQKVTAASLAKVLAALSVNAVFPSGDTSGATDAAAINAAISALPASGGTVRLIPSAQWYIECGQITITHSGVYLDMSGCLVSAVGVGDMIRMYSPNYFSDAGIGGGILGYPLIDGTSTTGNASAFHAGDILGLAAYCCLQNWTGGTTSKGIWYDNQNLWSEQMHGRIRASNCTAHVVFDVSGTPAVTATGSFERADLAILLNQGAAAHDGVVFQNGTYLVDGALAIRGNFTTASSAPSSAVLRLTGTAGGSRPDSGANSAITNSRLDIGVECDQATGTHGPQTIAFGGGGNAITACYGVMDFAASSADFQNSNASGGSQFGYSGRITGDSVLAAITQTTPSPLETDGGLLRVIQAGGVGTGGAAQVIIAGAGDGNQFSNFTLADNNSSNTWTASFREPSNNLLLFSFNGSTFVNALQVTQAGVISVLANTLALATGTASIAPLQLTAGTNLTAAAAGAVEYDGVAAYFTNETTSGRGLIPVEQRFRLTATGSNISTIANFFGSNSNISLVSGGEYEIEIDCWFLKNTAGAVTWTFTNSAAPTSMTIDYQLSPATGIVTTAAATDLFGQQYNVTTTAPTVVSGSLTTAVNHRHRFWIRLINGTGTSLKIQATAGAGTITPGINSYWKARRVPAANTGTFAA